MITLFRAAGRRHSGFRVVEGPAVDMKGFVKKEVDMSWFAREGTDAEFRAVMFLGQPCNCHESCDRQDPIVLEAERQEIES